MNFYEEKKNGKGKLINKDGNLLFEGEYLDEKEWNGKKYDGKGNVLYEIKDGCYPGQEKKINQKKKIKNFMKMVKLNLMEYILKMKNGQEKDMI